LKSGRNVGSDDPFVSSNKRSEEMVFEGQIFVSSRHLRNIDTAETGLVVFKDSGENQAFFDHCEFHTFRDFEKKCPHRNQFSHGHAECNIFGSSGAQGDVSLQFARPNDGAVEASKGESGSGLDTNRVLIVFISP